MLYYIRCRRRPAVSRTLFALSDERRPHLYSQSNKDETDFFSPIETFSERRLNVYERDTLWVQSRRSFIVIPHVLRAGR